MVVITLWRAWPLVPIFTGTNLKISSDFMQINSMLPEKQKVTQIYAGLSHPFWNSGELAKEVLLGPRKIIHGHGFKPEPNTSPKLKEIAQILTRPSTYYPWSGEKLCGGFHADTCFRWETTHGAMEILLCMGCHEVILYKDGQSQRCDLTSQSAEEITTILQKQKQKQKPSPAPAISERVTDSHRQE